MMTMTRVYCSTCAANFTEIAGDAALSPNFRFTCKECYPRDNRVRGLDTAHDPRLGRDPLIGRPAPQFSDEGGFHIDRKSPKRMKPGPEWSRSDAFLRELLADRTDEEKGEALLVLIGRWRQQETFEEIAGEVGISEPAVRAALSALRKEGNALWAKKQRAAAKAERNRQLSLRAQELFGRGLSVRQVAKIMRCSVGYASELHKAS